MTATASPHRPASTRTVRRTRSPRCPAPRTRNGGRHPLGGYIDVAGFRHEIIALKGQGGSVLVIDCNLSSLADERLLAHLGPDEPVGNARIVCEQYITDVKGRWCRQVTAEDLQSLPPAPDRPVDGAGADPDEEIRDEQGRSYRLQLLPARMSIPEVRWVQRPPEGQYGPVRVLSVREVIAVLQSYEPVREMSSAALSRHGGDRGISVSTLRGEIERLSVSRIVLNRGLREAVQEVTRVSGVSLSEIAMRCGRVKRDARGNRSGEASWLCRRLGLVPESGGSSCTPWIHSDVLALIARSGLGISPREVELG